MISLPSYCTRWIVLFCAIFATLFARGAHAEKTDIVVLRNGDAITGEIKGLDRGRLEYSTDDMGRIYIEWLKIASLRSTHRFEIEIESGRRFFGSLENGPEPGRLVIKNDTASVMLPIESVVRIATIESTFRKRIKGEISVGFSYARATRTAELTGGTDLRHRTEKYLSALYLSAYLNDREGVQTSRFEFQSKFSRFVAERWSTGSLLGALQSEELGIDNRILAGWGVTYFAAQTNKSVFSTGAGVLGVAEKLASAEEYAYDLEGGISLEFTRFTYDSPKSNINIALSIYPGITSWGRVRSEFRCDFKYEIVKDLMYVISFFHDYDNKPSEGAAQYDYRISTSLAWELK